MKRKKQELTSEEYVMSQIDKLQSRARSGEDEEEQQAIDISNDDNWSDGAATYPD